MTVSPNPAKAPAQITVAATPDRGCGFAAVHITVTDVRTGESQTSSITLNPDDAADDDWSATIAVDHAGDFDVDALCEFNPDINGDVRTAGDHGYPYQTESLDVDANLVATPPAGLVGSTHAITPATGGLCEGGTVALSIKAPDGSTSSATPTVDGSGAWSSPLTTSQVGTYTVTGTCTQPIDSADGSVGHLSAAQAAPSVEFSYGPVDVLATAAATTTTTAPPAEAQPATAVRAQPTFTG